MCWQCVTNHYYYGHVVPGWSLFYAADKEYWCLIQSNDPTFVWSVDPMLDNSFGLSDEEIDAQSKEEHKEWDEFHDRVLMFAEKIECDPLTGYRLVRGCEEAGFDPEEGGFSHWLFHKISELALNTVPDDQFKQPDSHGMVSKGSKRFWEEQSDKT